MVEPEGYAAFLWISIPQLSAIAQTEMVSSLEGMKAVFNEVSEYVYSYDALSIVPEVQVPVYFVQGKYEFNTPSQLARDYLEGLTATRGKYWFEFEDAAHFPFYEEPEDFLKVLKRAFNN